MSAVVCGKRSSFFEDLPSSPPNVSSKRIRCSSSSPVRFSPPRPTTASPFSLTSSFSSHSSAIDLLSTLFPDMDKQLLERALKECGDDLDLAIRSLNELRLGSTENLGSDASNSHIAEEEKVQSRAPGTGQQFLQLLIGPTLYGLCSWFFGLFSYEGLNAINSHLLTSFFGL
jgi:hypothetical protein